MHSQKIKRINTQREFYKVHPTHFSLSLWIFLKENEKNSAVGALACPPSPILFRHRKRTKRDNLSLLQFCQNRLGRFLKMEGGGLHFLKSSAGLEENYYAALRRHSFRKRLLLRYTMASF